MPAELAPIHFDFEPPKDREIQANCGEFIIYLTEQGIRDGLDAKVLSYNLFIDLQHRAQGATGNMLSDGKRIRAIRELGMANVVLKQGSRFPDVDTPKIAMGHMRYPTSGSSNHLENVQPFNLDGIWFAHHGNLTNVQDIKAGTKTPWKKELSRNLLNLITRRKSPDSDSWVALNAIARAKGKTLGEKLIDAQTRFEGGWAFVLSDGKSVVASRDPYGIRPLTLGYLGSEERPQGYIVSVESSAFKNIPQIRTFREVEPGETIQIDESGVKSLETAAKGKRLCLFEHVYMAWVNTVFGGKDVYKSRENAGRLLWKDAPVQVKDGEELIVVPVPDAARPTAEGFLEEAQKELGFRVRLKEALIKNKYVGRNYINPSNHRNVDTKFQVIDGWVKDKIVVLIDDSIVRGDTMPTLVAKLLKAEAKEVHVRIASPEIVFECYFGIDMSGVLIANKIKDIQERAAAFGAKSLYHLSLERLIEAVGIPQEDLCTKCFGGDGPPFKINVIPLNENGLTRVA